MPEAATNLADKAALDTELIAKARSLAPGLADRVLRQRATRSRQPRAEALGADADPEFADLVADEMQFVAGLYLADAFR